MARLIHPKTTAAALHLLTSILTRHEALGADSPLHLLLLQKGISLPDAVASMETAIVHEKDAATLRSESENYTALRKLKTAPLRKTVSGMVQMLKTYYKPAYTEVGLWGIDITTTGRIYYPTNVAAQHTMVKTLVTKNNAFPAGASPLSGYLAKKGISTAALLADVTEAANNNTKAAELRRKAEKEIALRNAKLAIVLPQLRTIGGYLMDFYSDNPRETGLWGFLVEETERKPAQKTSRIRLGDSLTMNSVIIGGTLTNMGETEVFLYKGKTISGEPITLLPGEVITVPKGYSILTVKNTSSLKTAMIKVTISR
ncbi:MAG: hypothetical protein JWP69_1808 [Flaviaesturariibacter sp.]|nr:hypothetical protein [Flaviaesturariibacter sp.]